MTECQPSETKNPRTKRERSRHGPTATAAPERKADVRRGRHRHVGRSRVRSGVRGGRRGDAGGRPVDSDSHGGETVRELLDQQKRSFFDGEHGSGGERDSGGEHGSGGERGPGGGRGSGGERGSGGGRGRVGGARAHRGAHHDRGRVEGTEPHPVPEDARPARLVPRRRR
ncbi:hypothetical protein F8144_40240, partial [Streptomyces triticiradicis]